MFSDCARKTEKDTIDVAKITAKEIPLKTITSAFLKNISTDSLLKRL